MKILFLGEPDSPNTATWVDGLRSLGCEVFIATVRPSNTGKECYSIGLGFLPARLRILTGIFSLKRLIAKINPDLLLAYRVTSYGFLAAQSGFHPFVVAAQNERIVFLPEKSPLRSWFLGMCARFALKRSDLAHAWSKNIAEGLNSFGLDESKILTLHRGINTKAFKCVAESRTNRSFNPDAPVFLSTRSLYREYRIDDLLIAFSLLVKKIPRARLEIAGDGAEEERLQILTKKLGLEEQVSFHGRLSNDELLSLMESSDIYISIIATEGMSSSLLEAVVAQLFPIVVDMPASRFIVKNNINGICLQDTSKKTLLEAMRKAVCQYDGIKHNLNSNATIVASQYDRDQNLKTFIEKYENLIKTTS